MEIWKAWQRCFVKNTRHCSKSEFAPNGADGTPKGLGTEELKLLGLISED
jgi:hypothetical protein